MSEITSINNKIIKISGDWTFKTTPSKKIVGNELYNLTCGHTLPSHEKNAYKSLYPKKRYVNTLNIKMKKNDQALIMQGNKKKVN